MRRILYHLHKNRPTPITGIFGTIKGGSTTEALLSRILSFDYSRITRTPMAILDNDAKSCYDRIPVEIAGVCLRRIGLPDNFVRTFTEQLRRRVRDVKIAQGLSMETISEEKYGNLCGVGQGNAGGPVTWNAVLEVLVMALTMSIPQIFVAVHPHDNSRYALLITSYVDDCSSVINVEQEKVIRSEKVENGKAKLYQELTIRLQELVNCWASILRFSGGDIEVNKSYIQIVDW